MVKEIRICWSGYSSKFEFKSSCDACLRSSFVCWTISSGMFVRARKRMETIKNGDKNSNGDDDGRKVAARNFLQLICVCQRNGGRAWSVLPGWSSSLSSLSSSCPLCFCIKTSTASIYIILWTPCAHNEYRSSLRVGVFVVTVSFEGNGWQMLFV